MGGDPVGRRLPTGYKIGDKAREQPTWHNKKAEPDGQCEMW